MPNAWAIKGATGTLRAGSRPAARLGAWEAKHVEGSLWRFTFAAFEPDPYWFEHGEHFSIRLEMHKGGISGPVEITSRDPLIVEMEIVV